MVDNLPSYPCAKLKLDQFFLAWLNEHQDIVSVCGRSPRNPCSGLCGLCARKQGGLLRAGLTSRINHVSFCYRQVNQLLEDAQAGRPLRGPATALSGPSPLSPSTAHAIFNSTVRVGTCLLRSRGVLSAQGFGACLWARPTGRCRCRGACCTHTPALPLPAATSVSIKASVTQVTAVTTAQVIHQLNAEAGAPGSREKQHAGWVKGSRCRYMPCLHAGFAKHQMCLGKCLCAWSALGCARKRMGCRVGPGHPPLAQPTLCLTPQLQSCAPLQPPLSQLPQFYFPHGQQPSDSLKTEFSQRLDKHFQGQPIGLTIDQFAVMAQEVSQAAWGTGPDVHLQAGGVANQAACGGQDCACYGSLGHVHDLEGRTWLQSEPPGCISMPVSQAMAGTVMSAVYNACATNCMIRLAGGRPATHGGPHALPPSGRRGGHSQQGPVPQVVVRTQHAQRAHHQARV